MPELAGLSLSKIGDLGVQVLKKPATCIHAADADQPTAKTPTP